MGRYRPKRDGWCQWPGCDQRATRARKRMGVYCDPHRAMAEERLRKRRGDDHVGKTTKERGYGSEHRRLRDRWAAQVEAGQAFCARCGKWIPPGTPFDLGHDDNDPTRSTYTGAEHVRCNRRTAAHRAERRQRYYPNTSREW